jgi:peptidoglycan/xylan/chitin deacetylase (PgdA/CDA1 family)
MLMKNHNSSYVDTKKTPGYISLCYHYIRPDRAIDRFPKILCNRIDDFHKHIKLLKENFQILSPENALEFSNGSFSLENGKYGLLFTFDDGLSDHFTAAKILSEYGIKALFFIPTCVLADKLPANPTIIHYCLSAYSISNFLKNYND